MAIASQKSERMGVSRGQIITAIAALLMLIGFFLPWVNAAGNPSGLTLASTTDALTPLGGTGVVLPALLYLVPILAIVGAVLAFLRTRMAGPMIAGSGLIAFAVIALALSSVTRTPAILEASTQGSTLPFFGVGTWLSIVGTLAMALGGVMIARQYLTAGQTLTTRRIVTAGMLGAIAITLGVTQLGFIPVPNATGFATIMHIPAIIGAVLEGPIVGIIAGGIFGIFSWLNDTTGLFSANPLIAILPRVLIGLFSWLVYRSLAGFNRDIAASVAGVVGTLTNTILVVGMLVGFGIIPAAVIPTILPQAIMELVAAAVLTPLVVRGINITRSGRTTAEETGPREKSYF